ncbi:uncharacterized protein F4807DRAFT_195784 [Annulohypoxylon truncatum]|uniref:uncharacterized protein n=1 Tax=Annulohypoxylon truncatum TaxID=327061 RepID=UPI002007E81A|nr:uncharacterized protein F4807DRAFT_195784 [Annulohypoxylon truncatum]KAI1213668.1 hypothetical protein F4807DRAFT_195784 [Annulohypoxylon truncatum]
MTITMMIAYLKGPRFDMEYYLQHHLPMVTPIWKPFGMGAFRTMAPTDSQSPYAMLTQIEWPDMEAFNRAQAETSADTSQRFMEDIKNFTDKDPVIWFMENKAGGA